ncbi:hypothetical protein A8G00_17785 [Sphingobium sp. SA916]|nr:hypothetical protein A8G00_17785 [Sphingobium sp. SA916]
MTTSRRMPWAAAASPARAPVAQFVQDDEVRVDEPVGDLPGAPLGLFLFEGVDQLDRGEEADALAVMLDSLNTQRRGDMGFAGARAADQHHIVGDIDKVASMQLAHQRLIHLAAGKVEARQIPIGREPRDLELIGHGPDLSFGRFGFQQLGEDRHRRLEGRRSLLHQIGHSLIHAGHFQAAQHDDEGAGGGIMTHDGSPGAGHRSVRHWPSAR